MTEITEKCPRCGSKAVMLQGTSFLSFENWRNLKELRMECIGYDKRKPPRKHRPPGHEYPDCHQMFKLKIKVLGIEPD